MGSKFGKRKDCKSSIVPTEKTVLQKSGGEVVGLPTGYGELLGEIKTRTKAVVERLAADIQSAFPGIRGFSALNIRRMRAFYLAYTEEVTNLSWPMTELDGAADQVRAIRASGRRKLPYAFTERGATRAGARPYA